MPRLTNEFSWSISRDVTFQQCPRRYYYHYYGSWGGWEMDADEKTREIYVLKQLTTRQMWQGQVVHECIRRTMTNLKNGVPPLLPKEIIDKTRERMRADYRSSRQGTYRQRPKTLALYEHEYEVAVSEEEWKGSWEHVEKCLDNFYSSAYYAKLHEMPRGDFIQVEEFDSFRLDDVKIHAVLDLAYRENELFHIVDWKTGKSDSRDNKMQLVCYALYGAGKWQAPLDKLRITEYNLYLDRMVENGVAEGDIDAMKEYMRGSVADMRRLLSDVEGNKAEEENFPGTTNAVICGRCNFQKLCPVRGEERAGKEEGEA